MPTEPTASAVKVFFSYAHEDEKMRNALEAQLAILQRQGKISAWHDRKISAGREWAGTISAELEAADVILLLVSSAFIASDYCYDIEMKRALERHETGSAVVVPVILRPTAWEGAPFSKLQALPTDARPISKWSNRDEAFANVAAGLKAVVESLAR